METQAPAADLDGSHLIQITHKHPDLRHRVRTDLDLEELVLASYSIALANKIIPFLKPEGCAKSVRRSRSPSRRQSLRKDTPSSPPLSQASTAALRSDCPTLAPSTTRNGKVRAEPPTKYVHFVDTPHKRFSTPTRQLLPAPSLSPTGGTTFTSRTITPNGTFFSPLKNYDTTPSRIFFARPQDPKDIPSAFFSPPHPRPLPKALPHSTVRRGPGRKGPLPIVEFDPVPRMIERNWPKPTLILRHNVDTSALRDVFSWARRCAESGGLVGLQGWLIHFRDVTRLRKIREVCLMLKLRSFTGECDRLLDRWEDGEWNNVGEQVENEFDRVLRAEELAEAQRNSVMLQGLKQGIAPASTLMDVKKWGMASDKCEPRSMDIEVDAQCPLAPVIEAGSQGQGVGKDFDMDMEDIPLVQWVKRLPKAVCE